jgi:hypothetical protein
MYKLFAYLNEVYICLEITLFFNPLSSVVFICCSFVFISRNKNPNALTVTSSAEIVAAMNLCLLDMNISKAEEEEELRKINFIVQNLI